MKNWKETLLWVGSSFIRSSTWSVSEKNYNGDDGGEKGNWWTISINCNEEQQEVKKRLPSIHFPRWRQDGNEILF